VDVTFLLDDGPEYCHVREPTKTILEASGGAHNKNERNKLKYHCQGTVTVDHTEGENTDHTTVTAFAGDSIHSLHAVNETGGVDDSSNENRLCKNTLHEQGGSPVWPLYPSTKTGLVLPS